MVNLLYHFFFLKFQDNKKPKQTHGRTYHRTAVASVDSACPAGDILVIHLVFKYSRVCANLEASNQRSAVPVRWPAPYFVWSLIYCFAQLWCMR